MEEHYVGEEDFRAANCMGTVWELHCYTETGDCFVQYEIELSYENSIGRILIPEAEIPDLLKVIRQAFDYAQERREEQGSAVSSTPFHQ